MNEYLTNILIERKVEIMLTQLIFMKNNKNYFRRKNNLVWILNISSEILIFCTITLCHSLIYN